MGGRAGRDRGAANRCSCGFTTLCVWSRAPSTSSALLATITRVWALWFRQRVPSPGGSKGHTFVGRRVLQHINGQRQLLGGDTYFDLFHANFDVANLDLASKFSTNFCPLLEAEAHANFGKILTQDRSSSRQLPTRYSSCRRVACMWLASAEAASTAYQLAHHSQWGVAHIVGATDGSG